MISSDWRSQIFEKKNKTCGPNLGLTGLNQEENEVFRYFLEFGSVGFLEIAYNGSLQQFLTSSRSKIHEKNVGGPDLGQTSQNQAEIRLFAIFSSLVRSFFLKLHTIIACNNAQHLIEVKLTKKILETQI